MSDKILSANGITSGYQGERVLHQADFALTKGEMCGIIGPNGAGKTTLLRTLYGLLPLDEGNIFFESENVSGWTPRSLRLLGIGYVPQEMNVFPNLSVAENLDLALTGRPELRRPDRFKKRLDYIYDLFPRLAERRNQVAGLMSGGEQRMVAISIGLMAQPNVLLLDEPTTGLAPSFVQQLMNTMASLNRNEGITIVIVEQNIMSMLKIVHSLYLLKDGRSQRFEGDPEEIASKNIWEYM